LEHASDEEAKMMLDGVFGFHPLAIEDCLTVSERPKVDEYDNYLFMVIHAVDYTRGAEEFLTTELNIFMGKDFLVTFHREPLRSVAATIDRVMKNAPAVARAPDRLAHTMLDFLFENYRPVLEELSAEIGELEEKVLVAASTNILGGVLKVKTEVQRLRQIIAPQRDVIGRFARGEFKFVRAHLVPYYRDLHDQLVRIGDMAESYRDSLTNVLQVHLNLQQTQVNQIIKVLTVLATLALPMFIITSFYGMNVPHFPNLHPESGRVWEAYLWVFGVTGIWTLLLYWYLRRKGWF
jgi:magnesium transporter